jgi:hypothetical protein
LPYDLTVLPLREFYNALSPAGRTILYILLATAATLGFLVGRLRSRARSADGGHRRFGAWRFPTFQNNGESLVSKVLSRNFRAPDYHLMNHVTLRMDDGTTQVDHILVSRFGVFVIETKDYNGWIFAHAADKTWTSVRFRQKYRFQNPIHQNFRHVLAVQNLLDFVPQDALESLVVFCGNAEFKTEVPDGVVHIEQLVAHIKQRSTERIALNKMQYAVGRLETARLALSGQTDIEHVASLRRRFGRGAE